MFESEQIQRKILSDEKQDIELVISNLENKNLSLIEKINEFEMTKTNYFEIFKMVKTFILKCRYLFDNGEQNDKICNIVNSQIMESEHKDALDDIFEKFEQVLKESKKIQGKF